MLFARYFTKCFLDGIVDESSDEEESDEEVLDLSASEDENDLLELYESEDERTADSKVEDSWPPSVTEHNYPEKPLPPLPNTGSGDILEPVGTSDSVVRENIKTVDDSEVDLRISEKTSDESTLLDSALDKNEQPIPLFSSEDEKAENVCAPSKQEVTLDTVVDAAQKESVSSNLVTSQDVRSTVNSAAAANHSGNKTNETGNQESGNGDEDDQGR